MNIDKIIEREKKSYIKANLCMLPANKASNIGLYPDNSIAYADKDNLTDILSSKIAKPQHLYLTINEDVKDGEWCIIDGNDVVKWKYQKYRHYHDLTYEKIIATTDKSLNEGTANIPQLSQVFIEDYCKKGSVDEVLVEVEPVEFGRINGEIIYDWEYVLKINSKDNTVITEFLESERKFSLEEIRKIVKYVNNNNFSFPIENWDIKKWIKENL